MLLSVILGISKFLGGSVTSASHQKITESVDPEIWNRL